MFWYFASLPGLKSTFLHGALTTYLLSPSVFNECAFLPSIGYLKGKEILISGLETWKDLALSINIDMGITGMTAEEKPLAEMTIRRYLIGLKADKSERTKKSIRKWQAAFISESYYRWLNKTFQPGVSFLVVAWSPIKWCLTAEVGEGSWPL